MSTQIQIEPSHDEMVTDSLFMLMEDYDNEFPMAFDEIVNSVVYNEFVKE